MTQSTVTLVIPGRNCEATLDLCLQSVVPFLSTKNTESSLPASPSPAPTHPGSPLPASPVTAPTHPGSPLPTSAATAQTHPGSPLPASGRGAGGEGPSECLLKEIIFVDDGSTDLTPEIAARYPIRIIQGTGQGPGAARNLGWQAADSELIWFIDSDCVAEPDALEKLLPHMNDPEVAGVGGSYSNLYPDSLIATLIHEEIIARHRRMPRDVDFLGGFNVLYRRCVLDSLDGYDESATNGPGAAGAEDCDLSFRAVEKSLRLHFELTSRVGHHHPTNLISYLRAQCRHGSFRVSLFLRHRHKLTGDSYAGVTDYLQLPIALLACLSLPATLTSAGRGVFLSLLVCQIVLQLSMTLRLVGQRGVRMMNYFWFGSMRAVARAVGLLIGCASELFRSERPVDLAASDQPVPDMSTVDRGASL
jgi:cellulose synthase/poly-beta-1,6-N-acetylglucosamine synthase-like glycosyltransferase